MTVASFLEKCRIYDDRSIYYIHYTGLLSEWSDFHSKVIFGVAAKLLRESVCFVSDRCRVEKIKPLSDMKVTPLQ